MCVVRKKTMYCISIAWRSVYVYALMVKCCDAFAFDDVVGIPMGTNCAPLLADLFLYSYESEFLQKFVKDKKIHEGG